MLRSLHIKNFRVFRDLKIEHLSRVNLIAGKNNTGKTALLEALYLLFCDSNDLPSFPYTFRNSLKKNLQFPDEKERRDMYVDFWDWLLYRGTTQQKTEITAADDHSNLYLVDADPFFKNGSTSSISFRFLEKTNKQENSDTTERGDVKITINGDISPRFFDNREWPQISVFSTQPTSPFDNANVFNQLVIKRRKPKLIELLTKVIEPELKDLQYSKIVSEPLVYAELNLPELISITQLGQGFTRVFRFFCEVLLAEAKIVLIDEIENGLHYSILEDVWQSIAEIAEKEDLQVFATTHSWECIEAAHKVFKKRGSDDFALHRFQKVKGEIQVVTHDQNMIEVASETDLEIR